MHCYLFGSKFCILAFLATVLVLIQHQQVSSRSTSFSEALTSLRKSDSSHKKVTSVQSKSRFRRQANEQDESDAYTDVGFSDMLDEAVIKELYKGPVCSLIDVRDHPKNLRDLENCTIVDGFVNILLFNDHQNQSRNIHDMDAYSFPKLRVITQYLLIYRVHRLTSLKRLFPNLVMIGGRKLFRNYALVIYENPDLNELGLHNMQYITNGSVRIENNGKLCYLNTIDWSLLGKVSRNKKLKDSVIRKNNVDGCIDLCAETNCKKLKNQDNIDKYYCWGVDSCQIDPYDCNPSEEKCKCHEECLGGCYSSNNNSACFACRKYYFNQTCVKECPKDTHLSSGWHCLEEDRCIHIGGVFHGGLCLNDCPVDFKTKQTGTKYVESKHRPIFVCEECNGNCAKVCQPPFPIKITNSLTLRHPDVWRCTIIEQQLTISDVGLDLMKELEEGLGELQEVSSLNIRETDLTSLSFFKNLKNITGKKDDLVRTVNGNFSVYVLNNERLRDLWPFESPSKKVNLTIGRGKAFFHFNPHLCLDKIKKLEKLTPGVEDARDVSTTTNGDRIACIMNNITELTFKSLLDNLLMLKWRAVLLEDPRTLIGYHVNYKISKFKNASRFDENPDGTSSWSKQYVDNPGYNKSNPYVLTSIFNLLPYTQYAFYISTYTLGLATTGAMSNIRYFTTNASRPTTPINFALTSLNYSAISLSWDPPQKPNGNITHYVIRYKKQPDDVTVVNQVNTCLKYSYLLDKPDKNSPTFPQNQPQAPPASSNNQQCCSCNGKPSRKNETEAAEAAKFEDYLIDNLIYWQELKQEEFYAEIESNEILSRSKRSLGTPLPLRYKRNVTSTPPPEYTNTTTNSSSKKNTKSSFITHYIKPENNSKEITVKDTIAVIVGLEHFSEYYFEVKACNHASKKVGCGNAAIGTRRTKMQEGVDVIASKITFKKQTKKKNGKDIAYLLSWSPPTHPNSFIKNYNLQYLKGSELVNSCCSAMEFNRNHTCVVSLSPGTYRVKVQPVSLAGPGQFSSLSKSFEIEEPSTQSINLTTILTICGVLAVLIPIITYIIARKQFQSKTPPMYSSVNPEYHSVIPYVPDEYELPEEDINLLREIGQGHFGKVYVGLAKRVVYGQSETTVAVKTLHDNQTVAKRMDFLKEATVMKAFNSHHVVRLLGVVSTTTKPMVVMEFMEKGDLKSYLRSTRPDAEINRQEPLSLQQKLQMCGEIADGMAYLAANKFVHRDLAARNCLVHKDSTVKIGDFGLTRDVYETDYYRIDSRGDFGLTRDVYETDYYRIDSRGILPVRWMAPESLKDGVFDSRSDVWSYGVVLWEIATLAEQPYQGQEHVQVTRFVIDGGYMEQPKNCPNKLYDLMLLCWDYSPNMRPTFMEIINSLTPDLNEQFKEVSYYYEPKEGDGDPPQDEAFHEGSNHSSDPFILRSNSASSGRGDAPTTRIAPGTNGLDNYKLLNGGIHTDPSNEQPPVSENNDSIRYMSQAHRQASTIC